MPSSRAPTRATGDFLLSTIFLVSLTVLVLNDFELKRFTPGNFTGKASDLAGPVAAALLLVAGSEFISRKINRTGWAKPSWFAGAFLVVLGAFAFIKLTLPGATLYAATTDRLIDLLRPAAAYVGWTFSSAGTSVVRDPYDVAIALLAGPLVYYVGLRWRGKRAGTNSLQGNTHAIAED